MTRRFLLAIAVAIVIGGAFARAYLTETPEAARPGAAASTSASPR